MTDLNRYLVADPEPALDIDAALHFLATMRDDEPRTLCAIGQKPGQMRAATFTNDQDERIRAWLREQHAAGANLYFVLNDLRASCVGRKPKEEDVAAAGWLQVDVDPRTPDPDEADVAAFLASEQARILDSLRAFAPPPTVIVFSGGGMQAFWRLHEPVALAGHEDIARVKRVNVAIAKVLGGDSCQSLDHVFRLVGSVNRPSPQKQEKGRQAAVAALVEHHSERTYSLDDFAGLVRPEPTPSVARRSEHDLPPLDDRWQQLVETGDDPNEPGKYPSRSEALFAACCAMVRAGWDDDPIVAAISDPKNRISDSVLDKGAAAADYARRQVERAREKVSKGRPVIVMRGGMLTPILDRAEAALRAAACELYQRGDALVRVAHLEKGDESDGVRRASGSVVLTGVQPHWLVEQMHRAAVWMRLTKNGSIVLADPDGKYARHYLDRAGEWRVPPLRGLVQTPTLRADGSVLQVPGYDCASQLLYLPNGMEFPPVPEAPTKEDAVAALERIAALFAEFPFVDEADRSVVLAAVLTGLVRRSLRSAPLFALDAPTAGTGKSLIAEVVGVIMTGAVPAHMSQGKSPEEDEKRLSTVLMAGDPLLVIDNCDRAIEGDFLCSMLTQERVQARILGKSERSLLPANALVIATGNNLVLAGDVTRRALICRLDAQQERPDRRQFKSDPRAVAREQRPELVVAGLTVLRAYIVAGRPNPMDKIGSFEEWNVVREALVWLGRADPALTRERVFQDDPRKDELLDLLEAWHDCFGSEPRTLAQVREACGEHMDAKWARLYHVLVEVSGRREFNARSIGRRLRGYVDRVVGGLALRRANWQDRDGGVAWFVRSRSGESVPAPDPGPKCPIL